MKNAHASHFYGPLEAVVLDWAGTAVDFGSRAPVDAFIEAFAAQGVAISALDARGPMGTHKRDHLKAILNLPHVMKQWQKRHGKNPDERDIDQIFKAFVPAQMAVLKHYATPIPGVLEGVAHMRARGLKLGSTTGYVRSMLDVVAQAAKELGYAPDVSVAADEAAAGRPQPWMLWRNLQLLNVNPPAACVKIGDTVADVQEGQAAGCWTVALVNTGNEVGLTHTEWLQAPDSMRRALQQTARQKLEKTGAHYVIDDWSVVPDVLAEIDKRLAAGERP